MRTLFFSVSVALAASALGGCASPTTAARAARPSTTTITAAGLESEAPAAREAPAAVADAPAGELVCRTKISRGGTAELYLTWEEGAAKGTLRTVSPSGMVYLERVRAERYKSMIVVDGPAEPDLATHTAVVSKDVGTGKPYIRLGDQGSPWTACE